MHNGQFVIVVAIADAIEQKRPFLIPLVLDIERGKGKRDLDGAGMAPVIRVCRDQHG